MGSLSGATMEFGIIIPILFNLSEVIESLIRVVEIFANNPQLMLIVLGFLLILIGWAFDIGGIVAIGFYILILGVVSKKSRGEICRSPIHY